MKFNHSESSFFLTSLIPKVRKDASLYSLQEKFKKQRNIRLCVPKKDPEALEVPGRVKTLTYAWGGCQKKNFQHQGLLQSLDKWWEIRRKSFPLSFSHTFTDSSLQLFRLRTRISLLLNFGGRFRAPVPVDNPSPFYVQEIRALSISQVRGRRRLAFLDLCPYTSSCFICAVSDWYASYFLRQS